MGGADEEDADDERNFLDESFELHYNVAEVVGILLRTHGDSYTPVYMQSMHDSITQMSNPYCIKEDRQVAFFVICDVIEFGFDTKSRFPNSAGGIATGLASMQQQSESIIPYLSQVIPILSEACVTPTISPGARQSCVYGIGVAAEKYPREFAPYAAAALQALASCVHLGEIPGKEERGSCTDNAVSSVGIILEQMEVKYISLDACIHLSIHTLACMNTYVHAYLNTFEYMNTLPGDWVVFGAAVRGAVGPVAGVPASATR
jgi:hypothetical protein